MLGSNVQVSLDTGNGLMYRFNDRQLISKKYRLTIRLFDASRALNLAYFHRKIAMKRSMV